MGVRKHGRVGELVWGGATLELQCVSGRPRGSPQPPSHHPVPQPLARHQHVTSLIDDVQGAMSADGASDGDLLRWVTGRALLAGFIYLLDDCFVFL